MAAKKRGEEAASVCPPCGWVVCTHAGYFYFAPEQDRFELLGDRQAPDKTTHAGGTMRWHPTAADAEIAAIWLRAQGHQVVLLADRCASTPTGAPARWATLSSDPYFEGAKRDAEGVVRCAGGE